MDHYGNDNKKKQSATVKENLSYNFQHFILYLCYNVYGVQDRDTGPIIDLTLLILHFNAEVAEKITVSIDLKNCRTIISKKLLYL